MAYRLTIKLEPYLQEYFTSKYSDPVYANGCNIVGAVIKPFLELMPRDLKPVHAQGPEFFTFEIPNVSWLDARNGTIWISPYNQKNVERILKAHFKDVLFQYVEDKIRYRLLDEAGNIIRKNTIKEIILQFCADSNITYNKVNYETLKKIYYRKKIENNTKFTNNLSRVCPLIFLL